MRSPDGETARGWVLFTEVIGHNPDDRTGLDFSTFSDQGYGVICRLNNGYEPEGTIPHSSQYENFARRVANFVSISRGCKIWIIGNEMNYAVERPGIVIDWSRHASRRDGPAEEADPMRRGLPVRFNVLPDNSAEIRTTRAAIVEQGEIITPERYARCYRLCREAIHRIPGHEDDLVLVGAVAPWNTQTIYPAGSNHAGNANGDWVQYFADILRELGPRHCDGFTLHAYTHGPDPALVTDETLLPPPFQQYHREFRAYRDFMAAVPPEMRHLPAFLTETGQTTPWLDDNRGWVQAAYAEINGWNHATRLDGLPDNARQSDRQQIRALVLYRWPRLDRWFIAGKFGVVADFEAAVQRGYQWKGSENNEGATANGVAAIPRAQQHDDLAELPSYAVAWIDDHFPESLVAGSTITVPITVRNAGSLTWRWGGGNPFRLGYHFYRNRRRLTLPNDQSLRTDIPQDVPPDGTVTIHARIALPAEAGNYTLELDLVQEGVTWFKQQHSPVLTRWLTVEAAPRGEAVGEGETVEEALLPVPLFLDISNRLPRKAIYARRSMSQVQHIVISHTGANPHVGLDRIARTHARHGYPGIVYQFVVARDGQVFRTSQLEEVAQPDQIWSEQGVNIALLGNFSTEAPPVAQLDATGRLCAWLAHNLGLRPESIIGLGDLIATDSPGDTFYAGPTWRDMIVRQVQLHLAALVSSHSFAAAAPPSRAAAGQPGRAPSGNAEEQAGQPTVVVNGVDPATWEALEERANTLEKESSDLQVALKRAETEQETLQEINRERAAEIARLTRELAAAQARTEGQFHIHNMIDDLPRDDHRYITRRPEDVQHIVVNHTGVDSDVSWRQIAEAHRADWPGIVYDFGIDADGAVHQFQPLDEVVETEQPYLAHAINIAFAGEFHEEAPAQEQIQAGAQLVLWLMERFPQLTAETIQGLREFIPEHSSPGEQWLAGAQWKQRLLAAVRRATGEVDPSVLEKLLRDRIGEIQQQLDELQQKHSLLERQKSRLETENHRLQGELQEKLQATRSYIVPKPSLKMVVNHLPRHPVLRYGKRSLSQITHIAVHHTAAPVSLGPLRIAELHVNEDPARGKEAWPGIGYHYFIHADGSIEQTNELETASYHVFQHNHYTVGVAFAGSFMNGRIPTSNQLR
ncbi:MAG: N-acetylmuramoyl-L-alanine amidase, partial [Caldilineaceae bacterium]|nr:N-acetylmuramoyl-L-alanine amidase [Caldilineaceae bacterium]